MPHRRAQHQELARNGARGRRAAVGLQAALEFVLQILQLGLRGTGRAFQPRDTAHGQVVPHQHALARMAGGGPPAWFCGGGGAAGAGGAAAAGAPPAVATAAAARAGLPDAARSLAAPALPEAGLAAAVLEALALACLAWAAGLNDTADSATSSTATPAARACRRSRPVGGSARGRAFSGIRSRFLHG